MRDRDERKGGEDDEEEREEEARRQREEEKQKAEKERLEPSERARFHSDLDDKMSVAIVPIAAVATLYLTTLTSRSSIPRYALSILAYGIGSFLALVTTLSFGCSVGKCDGLGLAILLPFYAGLSLIGLAFHTFWFASHESGSPSAVSAVVLPLVVMLSPLIFIPLPKEWTEWLREGHRVWVAVPLVVSIACVVALKAISSFYPESRAVGATT